jgi:inorganic pyrophosphatase
VVTMKFFQELNEAKLHKHLKFEGLDISIEVPAGGYRRGVNKRSGEEWAIKVPANYGYIKGTHSPDGEHLDCYVRKAPKTGAKVYVVHQLKVDGSGFDEDKVMLGYSTKNEAIRAFKSVTFKPAMYGGCTEFDMEHFQLAAFSASKSHAMLTNQETYSNFKAKGLLGRGIKSPIMIAKRVSESLSEGLKGIGSTLLKGDLLECLEWGGMDEGLEVDAVISRAYNHYATNPYMMELHNLSEQEFKAEALAYLMETDSLMTDVEDDFQEDDVYEEIENLDEDESALLGALSESSGLYHHTDNVSNLVSAQYQAGDQARFTTEGRMAESKESYVVVVHTQIMENIGTQNQPSWATRGGQAVLVQEGFQDYGSARAVAAQVSSGQIPVELSEGAYVLSIDVMPTGEYRQFHEDANTDVEEEEVVEDVTDDVFFAQQVQETAKLAGIVPGTYTPTGTPTVQETRERLERLSRDYMAESAVEERDQASATRSTTLTPGQLAQTLRIVRETMAKNPRATPIQAIRAVCKKVHNDVHFDRDIIEAAELEYGSLHEFEAHARGTKAPPSTSRVITKHEKM